MTTTHRYPRSAMAALCTAAILALVFTFAPILASASTVESVQIRAEDVAEVNGVGYTTLPAAVEAAPAGSTVRLLKDVDTDGRTPSTRVEVNKVLTIDLNGYEILHTTGGDGYAITVTTGGQLAIEANTEGSGMRIVDKQGSLTNLGFIRIEDNACLSVNGGHFEDQNGYAPSLIYWDSPHGSTRVSLIGAKMNSPRTCVNITAEYQDCNVELVVSGGEYISAESSVFDFCFADGFGEIRRGKVAIDGGARVVGPHNAPAVSVRAEAFPLDPELLYDTEIKIGDAEVSSGIDATGFVRLDIESANDLDRPKISGDICLRKIEPNQTPSVRMYPSIQIGSGVFTDCTIDAPDAKAIELRGGLFETEPKPALLSSGCVASPCGIPGYEGFWIVGPKGQYAVRHLFEQVDSNEYAENEALVPEETRSDVVGNMTSAAAHSIDGFEAPAVEQRVISRDGDTVVEIRYKRLRYDVTFDSGLSGVMSPKSQQVKHGVKAAAPEALQCVGYAFEGWLIENGGAWVPYDFDTLVTSSIALRADWTLNAPAVSIAPTIAGSPVEPGAEHAGDVVTLTAAVDHERDDLQYRYEWRKDGVALDADAPSIDVSEPGAYQLCVTVSDGVRESRACTQEIALRFDAWADYLSFASTKLEKHVTDGSFANELTVAAPEPGKIAYASSDERVATVDANGRVTIVGAGKATITARAKKTATHAAAEASYEVTVTPHELAHVPAVKPTVDKTGAIEHWACTICGALFADADGTEVLTPEEIELPKADPEKPDTEGPDTGEGTESEDQDTEKQGSGKQDADTPKDGNGEGLLANTGDASSAPALITCVIGAAAIALGTATRRKHIER